MSKKRESYKSANAANKRKRLLKKYEVTMVREVEYRAVVEVEAESEDVAKQMAEAIADNGSNRWVEGDCLSHTVMVKVTS